MSRLLKQFIIGIFVCFFININWAIAQEPDFIIEYDTAFTIRDSNLDGQPDDFEHEPSTRFWGSITNSEYQSDEFFVEFDIRNIEPALSAKFYYFFSRTTPPLSSGNSIDFTIADYEGDGIADLNKLGIGDDFAEITISNVSNINVINVTDILNDYIDMGISHLGLRFHNPISSQSTTGKPAQLIFALGYLNIISANETDALEDMMHPTGAVHAKTSLLWPSYRGNYVLIKIKGYVLDELSIAQDWGGIGVSSAYIEINDRKMIVLKDGNMNLLDENGRFNYHIWYHIWPPSEKVRFFRIKLFASDTAPEGPNFGLVDSTIVQLPKSVLGYLKFRDNWFRNYRKH